MRQALVVLREPVVSMRCGMLTGTTKRQLSLLSVIREMASFGRKEQASQVSEEKWLLCNLQNLGKGSFLGTRQSI